MEEREEEREGKRALHEEPALARAPRHFVRMRSEPHNKKVVHSFDLLLYMLTIRWVVDDMALAYSQQLAILLTMLLNEVLSALNGLVTQVFHAYVLSLLVPHDILCLRGRLSSYTWWSTGRGQGWS